MERPDGTPPAKLDDPKDLDAFYRLMGADAVTLGDPDEARTHELIASVRRAAPGLPVLLAGHTHHENAARLLADADGHSRITTEDYAAALVDELERPAAIGRRMTVAY